MLKYKILINLFVMSHRTYRISNMQLSKSNFINILHFNVNNKFGAFLTVHHIIDFFQITNVIQISFIL